MTLQERARQITEFCYEKQSSSVMETVQKSIADLVLPDYMDSLQDCSKAYFEQCVLNYLTQKGVIN